MKEPNFNVDVTVGVLLLVLNAFMLIGLGLLADRIGCGL